MNLMADYKTWAVRMYLGGGQRLLGYTKEQIPYGALRFADMARQYFWKYRVRNATEPNEGDLNLSLDRVQQDMAHETHAVAMLKEIEDHLISVGALLSPEQKQAILDNRHEDRRRNRTLSGSLQVMNHEWVERLGSFEERIEALSGRMDTLAQKLGEMTILISQLLNHQEDHLNRLDKKLDVLANQLSLIGHSEVPVKIYTGTLPNETPNTVTVPPPVVSDPPAPNFIS